MTDIGAITGVTGAGGAARTGGPQTVDYDAFLKLLVAQMQNQDPTQPMSDTEYIAQLASFSNVEQSTKLNDKLDYLIQMSSIQQAGSLIGRSVTSADGLTSGVISEMRILSDGAIAVLDNGAELPVGPGLTVR
ncbi:flagellar hook assembly protein FlgD [Roseitalea porphyridii]|uniref:Basal-body rod modification protein FlgD n=1 Tax=Roseitalea porphyridii TaxID=1852022 RepID=A0A4P6V097_9HYPH|nr:flagellar hook assembly protein FlgD [Roseitalea porphyridii]QBK30505.1 flagellar hook assembly protein FlgD [Roseitalea porphyridii]